MVGTKPVSARFSLLPETKPRMSALGTSLVVQIILVAFVVTLPLLFPQQMIPRAMYMVTDLAGPPLDIPEPPKPKPPAPPKVAKVEPPPPPVEKPSRRSRMLRSSLRPKIVAPKPKPRQVEVELPKVNDTFKPMNMKVATKQPARPRDPVKTGMMTGGSSAVPTMTSPRRLRKFRPEGSAIPNGVAGPSDPNKRATVAQFGDPALPPGSGYGNGTGGANGPEGCKSLARDSEMGSQFHPPGDAPKVRTCNPTGFANSNDWSPRRPRRSRTMRPQSSRS